MKVAEVHTDDAQVCEDLGHKDEVRALAAAMGRMDGALVMTFVRLSKEAEALDQSADELVWISNEMIAETEM